MKKFAQKYNIEESYNKLSPARQQALDETDWEKTVLNICKEKGMLLDETGVIIREVGLVLLGVQLAGTLENNLWLHADISEKEAADLVRNFNATVFIPMREKIKELSREIKESEQHPHRDEIMSQIEDQKDKETPAHKKLAELFSMPPGKSDYSGDPKETEANKPEKPKEYAEGEDPYHEPID